MTKISYNNLTENLEKNDLKRLVHPELHIDEYKSKMGTDEDICVISLKVTGKEPSNDLVNFIEKGYDFVLDADVSSGEQEDNKYLVFVEINRTPDISSQIIRMMSDIMNLTDQSLADWRVRYYKSKTDYDLTEENLSKIIPSTPRDYNKKFNKDNIDLDQLKTAAGVKVDTVAPTNEFTESLRVAAGIK